MATVFIPTRQAIDRVPCTLIGVVATWPRGVPDTGVGWTLLRHHGGLECNDKEFPSTKHVVDPLTTVRANGLRYIYISLLFCPLWDSLFMFTRDGTFYSDNYWIVHRFCTLLSGDSSSFSAPVQVAIVSLHLCYVYMYRLYFLSSVPFPRK